MEYTHSPLFAFPEPRPTTSKVLSRLTIENPTTWERFTLLVEGDDATSDSNGQPESDPAILAIHSLSSRQWATVRMLRQAVYMVESQPDFNNMDQDVLLWEEAHAGSSPEDRYTWRVYGLVDVGCRRVYAIRVDLQCGGDNGPEVSGFVLVPEYGDALLERSAVGTPVEVKPAAYNLDGMLEMPEAVEWEQPLNSFTARVGQKTSMSSDASPVNVPKEAVGTAAAGIAGLNMNAPLFTAMENVLERVLESKLDALLSARLSNVETKLNAVEAGISATSASRSVTAEVEPAFTTAMVERMMYMEASLRTMEAKLEQLASQQQVPLELEKDNRAANMAALEKATEAANKASAVAEAVLGKLEVLEQKVESMNSFNSASQVDLMSAIGRLEEAKVKTSQVDEKDLKSLEALAVRMEKLGLEVSSSTSVSAAANRDFNVKPSAKEIQSLESLAVRLESLTAGTMIAQKATSKETDSGLAKSLDALASRLESVAGSLNKPASTAKASEKAVVDTATLQQIKELQNSTSTVLKASDAIKGAVESLATVATQLTKAIDQVNLNSQSSRSNSDISTAALSSFTSKIESTIKNSFSESQQQKILISPDEIVKTQTLLGTTATLEAKMTSLLEGIQQYEASRQQSLNMDAESSSILVKSVVPSRAPASTTETATQDTLATLNVPEKNVESRMQDIEAKLLQMGVISTTTTGTTSEALAEASTLDWESRIMASLPGLVQDSVKLVMESRMETMASMVKETVDSSLSAYRQSDLKAPTATTSKSVAFITPAASESASPEITPTTPVSPIHGKVEVGLPKLTIDDGAAASKKKGRRLSFW
jgi:hypothetical protein